MPFRSETTPFTGDNDIVDFLTNVWFDFCTDTAANGGVEWIGHNSTPITVDTDQREYWVSRGTAMTPAPPYIFLRTRDNPFWGIMHFTGDGVDTMQEIFDQPGNPANTVGGSTMTPDFNTAAINLKCLYTNIGPGTFQKYWMFAPTDGRYVYCVIKTRDREYRHFHVGLLDGLATDFDADSFIVTSHFWDSLRGNETGSSGINDDRCKAPYSAEHNIPFKNGNGGTTGGSFAEFQFSRGQWLYLPNLNGNTPTSDFYATSNDQVDNQLTSSFPAGGSNPYSKTVGDVNTVSGSTTFYGVAGMTGYDDAIGTNLFATEKAFASNGKPLVPIFVTAMNFFDGAWRQSPVAQVPDVFRINVDGIAAETEITVGSDTYVVFPMINDDSQNVQSGEGYSGYEGLAYRKETGLYVP
jgi:hypothetical protein